MFFKYRKFIFFVLLTWFIVLLYLYREHLRLNLDIDKASGVSYTNFSAIEGNLGKPVHIHDFIKGGIQALINKGLVDNAFNQFVSDLIPFDRKLPESRDKECLKRNYSTNLPEVSVVICFHNEAWSTLLRTIHSVLNRSPGNLLKEIILVDDYSSMVHLKIKLEDYIKTLPKIRLIRTERREGLIRARILGVKAVHTPAVFFIDSHCECTNGWLEPLLERITQNPKAVVSPVIDHIDAYTFEYIPQDAKNILIGGFNWNLKFIWIQQSYEIQSKRNFSMPVKTPTIAGGIFAIRTEFFKHIGYYDEGFDIWGGENLELSFKVWMCGGLLEIVPCSRVGHIFRDSFPYGGTKGSFKRNSIRLAEVWLDDYAKYFYQRIGDNIRDYGDVTARKQLRNKLKCKSFDWYINQIYPAMKKTINNAASGQIFNKAPSSLLCLDSLSTLSYDTVSVVPCHHQGGNQFWTYTEDGRIKSENSCLDYSFEEVILVSCLNELQRQVWLYEIQTKFIRHIQTQYCLQVLPKGILTLEKCREESSQMWYMDNFDINKLNPELKKHTKLLEV